MKPLYLFIFLLLFIPQISAISLSGGPMPADSYYEYGATQEHSYTFGTSSKIQDYKILITKETNYDITKFITVTPKLFKDMPPNSAGEFTVKLNFTEEQIPPGRHEALVIVTETQTEGGMVGALAQIAVRIRVISLYPTEYLSWGFRASNADIGEDVELKTTSTNWGIPDIVNAKTVYRIYDSKNQFIKEVESEMFAVESKKSKEIITKLSTKGMLPDDYKVIAKISYADQKATKEKIFRLGSKEIKINNITKEFVPNAINKVEVNIESGWNKNINSVKGKVIIKKSGKEIKNFRLLESSIKSWNKGIMTGYFDTEGLELGDYTASVQLNFEDSTAKKEFDIKIAEMSNTETVEQIPGSFSEYLTLQNGIMFLLLIILGMNVWYLIDKRKR